MIKLLMRLKARFDRKSKGQQPDRLPPAQPADQQESMSRVQENLAWLPVYKEPEPLRFTPRQVRTFLPHPSSETRLPDEPSPGPDDIDQLLSYLPLLYPDGVAIKTYIVKENTYWPDYFPVVEAFYHAVAKDCWCDIDYLNHGAADMLNDDSYMAEANLADIQTLLTYCIRGERFCDGHNGAMIEKGYVLKILRRLAVLRED